MGKYLQFLLTHNYELPSISNCHICKISYGINGWTEEYNGIIKTYRFVKQSHVDKYTIIQIVEEMEDGWVPSQILLTDTTFYSCLNENESVREESIGHWVRKSMVLPSIQLEDLQDEQTPQAEYYVKKKESVREQRGQQKQQRNQHLRTPHADGEKQLPLLPLPSQKQGGAAAVNRHAYNNKSYSNNDSKISSVQPSSYNKPQGSLKSHNKIQSSPIPLIPLIGASAKHYLNYNNNLVKPHL